MFAIHLIKELDSIITEYENAAKSTPTTNQFRISQNQNEGKKISDADLPTLLMWRAILNSPDRLLIEGFDDKNWLGHSKADWIKNINAKIKGLQAKELIPKMKEHKKDLMNQNLVKEYIEYIKDQLTENLPDKKADLDKAFKDDEVIDKANKAKP